MKRMMAAVLAAVLVGVWPVRAADSVEPQSVTFTNTRGEAVSSVNVGTIYRSTTLVLTNCQALISATATQGLDGVTVQVSVGDLSTNCDYTASVASTNQGRWSATILVPDLSSFLIQLKLTDGAGNSFIYPAKSMMAEQSMF